MTLIGWTLQTVVDDPVGELVIVKQLPLPAVGKAVPEQAEHVSDNDSQERHLDDVHDGQNGAIIGNLVVTVLVAVAALEEVKHLLLRDEARGAKTRDSEHFEKQKVPLRLHLLLGVAGQDHEPGEDCQEVNDEAAVEHVARGNQLDAIDGVVVLWV